MSSARAVGELEKAHIIAFLPRVNVDELSNLLSASDVIIVDARPKQDYEAGHIEKAINIPFNTPLHLCQIILGGNAKDTRVVVYCESTGCHNSNIVANKLDAMGYHNILIFRGGWSEWSNHREEQ